MHAIQFLLGLGSNLGDRAQCISQAIQEIKKIPGLTLLDISDAVDSDPVGYTNQGNFLNICLAIIYEKDSLIIFRESNNAILLRKMQIDEINHSIKNYLVESNKIINNKQ